jgi:type IV secretion system protein VirD4
MNHNVAISNRLLLGIDDKGKYCSSDGYQHVLLVAPTGSGKGVSYVIPNLLYWEESVIIHDVKLENFVLTSGWRKSIGQKIYVFDPLNSSGKTHSYNPFDFVSCESDQMVDDVSKIADLLIHGKKHRHIVAKQLFIALALYLISNSDKIKSIGEIWRIIANDCIKELSESLNNLKLHSHCRTLINSFLSKDQNECSDIISILASYLELFSNPLIDKATSKSDFNPADFKKEKSTLYVGVQPSDMERLKPLMQFFYQHLAQNLTKYMPDTKKEPYGVLLILDDFASIGKMGILTNLISYARGYRLKLLIVMQNLNKGIYCEKIMNDILTNSAFKVVFTPNSDETAKIISNLSIDKVNKKIAMSWEEIMSIPLDQQIILEDNKSPIILQKIGYYSIPEFKDKIMDPVKL